MITAAIIMGGAFGVGLLCLYLKKGNGGALRAPP